MMKMIPYLLAINFVLYVMLYTRLNVFYTLSVTSKYQSNLDEGHWRIIKNILKYLTRSKNVFLIYERDELVVHGYLDVSLELDIDDRKSMVIYVFTLYNGVVSWKSPK